MREEEIKELKRLKKREEDMKNSIHFIDEHSYILAARSREMTQLIRRINQSKNATARVFFGVFDNGDLVPAKNHMEVKKFFLQYIYEVIDEQIFSYHIVPHTKDSFLNLQLTFPQKEEVETGDIEYKSTGSHMGNAPIRDIPGLQFRVLELIVRNKKAHANEPKQKRLISISEYQAPPLLTLMEKEVSEPSTICRISRTREPCWMSKEWKTLSKYEKSVKRKEDADLIKHYQSLGDTLSAVTTAIILARQKTKGALRELRFPEDETLYRKIQAIQTEIIRLWETEGQDATNDKIKSITALIRVIWQAGELEERHHSYLLTQFLDCLECLEPPFNNDLNTFKSNDRTWELASYGLCVIGTLGRALPPPSTKRVQEEEMNTYERFRKPQILNQNLLDEIRKWARGFFKDMRPPCTYARSAPGASGCLEKPRSQGGVGKLISDAYKMIKGTNNLTKLPNVQRWKDHWWNYPEVEHGNLNAHITKNNEFAYAISLDMCRPYLEHIEKCPGVS
jgi:hypothetical protein